MSFKIVNKKDAILKETEKLIEVLYKKNTARYILGINDLTDELLIYFEKKGLSIAGIIDDFTYEVIYKRYPIVKMVDIPDKNSFIISCVVDAKVIEACDNLKNAGFRNFITYFHLSLFDSTLKKIHYCEENISDIKNNIQKYYWLYSILEDYESKQTLENIIDFRYNFSIESLRNFKYNLKDQYFDDFVEFDNSEIFVDCGGFEGETTLEFIEKCSSYERVYFFEPIREYFEKAKYNLRFYNNIIFFNKGTYCADQNMKFMKNKSSSCVSNFGEEIVEVVKLDNVINQKITYMKMDVEGAEYDSLIGAEKLIRTYKPKLAICVYHNQKDFWRIPELILNYNTNYKVFLRHYTHGLLETVMYFI
jgi:FkbM family methyltransferase